MIRNTSYPDNKSVLIINADDFGLTESCTLATIEAFHSGKISSMTMCANGQYYETAVNLVNKFSLQKKIGIHFNLTEGQPLTKGIKNDSQFCTNGVFHGKIDRKKFLSKESRIYAITELSAQYERLILSGITVTHADSHHHIHTAPGLFGIFNYVMKKHDIQKLRITRNIGKIKFIKKFLKDISNIGFHLMGYHSTSQFGSIMDLERGINFNKSLEIMVHPDYNGNHELIDRRAYDRNLCPVGAALEFNNTFLEYYKICSYYDGV